MIGRPAFLLLAALLTCRCGLAQAATLTLPTRTSPPGASVIFPVSFQSPLCAVAGIQFDLDYDSAVLTLTAVAGDAARVTGKSIYLADIAPNRKRFLLGGLNQTPSAAGTLLTLFVAIRSNAPDGAYPLKLSSVLATDPGGQPALILAYDGLLTVTKSAAPASPLLPEGVRNAASLSPGPVATGEILTLLGAGLVDTVVAFDGVPGTLLYTSPSQINVIAPYALYGKTSTQFQISRGNQPVAALTLPVSDTAPGIFTLDGSGLGPGAILNQDQHLNSPAHPAAKGSVITLFATGAGQTYPPSVDGQIATGTLPQPLLPVSVQIGGLDAEVLYAGAAPGLVAALLQVNCIVPINSTSGLSLPITLVVGTRRSQTGVTLAVN